MVGATTPWARDVLAVVGPATARQLVDIRPGEGYVGLRFRVGWGASSLALDLTALRDQAVDAAEATPALRRLARELASCGTSAQIAERLERFALRAAAASAPDSRAIDAVGRIVAGSDDTRIRRIARAVGLSERSLRREVTAVTGISPKTLARIARFQRALALKRATPTLGAADLSAACGYVDQAHMTREFRALGSITPSAIGVLRTAVLADSYKTGDPESGMLGVSSSSWTDP